MARILLGVTGGIAAYKACTLVRLLVRAGHAVHPVVTAGAARFVTEETFLALARRPRSTSPYPHLEPVDLLVVAPLAANTLARLAHGLADDVLTEAALAHTGPVLVAPAMNTRMWESPVTLRHLRQVFEDHAGRAWEAAWTLDDAAAAFAAHSPRILLIPPQAKRLACGDVGMGAMAEVVTIAEAVRAWGEGAASRG